MDKNIISSPSKATALLLTGGGARAAYQIGVLKAIATLYPRNHGLPFKILSGTSAGAINATALASYASCYHLGIKKLEWVWRNFSTAQVYKSEFRQVFLHVIKNLLLTVKSEVNGNPATSLFDNAPLRTLLMELLDFKRIDRNIENQFLTALSITASSYSSGNSVAFYQSNGIPSWQRAKRRGEQATINIDHLLASSAIPMLFPSVKIKQNYYGDGSIHQQAPLSPAIRLGAEKIFIIGVEQPLDTRYYGNKSTHPSFSTIAGHLLDTIFADTLRSDLERLDRINRTLSLLPGKSKHKELRQVQSFIINPSEDFNSIAKSHYSSLPFAVKALLRTLGVKRNSASSLTSYLLFEKEYTRHLIQIGYQDGMNRIDDIRAFLTE